MNKVVLVFLVCLFTFGCSSINNSIKQSTDLVIGNIALVNNIGNTFDAGGYTKEAAKAVGKPSKKLTNNDKKFEIRTISNSIKTLKNTKSNISKLIELQTQEYKKQSLNAEQTKKISQLQNELKTLNNLIDSNLIKGNKLLSEFSR